MYTVLLFALVFCVDTLDGLVLLRGQARNGSENQTIKSVSRDLISRGYKILGKNMVLYQRRERRPQAEFDLVVRDPNGLLCLIEIKFQVNPGKKVTRQFTRYVRYLDRDCPFKEQIKRVIVVTKPLEQSFTLPWQKKGLEFLPLINGHLRAG